MKRVKGGPSVYSRGGSVRLFSFCNIISPYIIMPYITLCQFFVYSSTKPQNGELTESLENSGNSGKLQNLDLKRKKNHTRSFSHTSRYSYMEAVSWKGQTCSYLQLVLGVNVDCPKYVALCMCIYNF